MSAPTEWRPKVGERVAIKPGRWLENGGEGVVKIDDGSTGIPFSVEEDRGASWWLRLSELSPLPAPASSEARPDWVKLRDAAEVLGAASTIGHYLRSEANRLEAAAARKPTLVEAVRAYDEGGGAKWSDVLEALAREQSA